MNFPNFTTYNVITLPETGYLAATFLMWMLSGLYALQSATRLLLPFYRQYELARHVEVSLRAETKTGLTANEKNSYQRSPERRSSSGHGRWSATLRSGRGSPVPGTEKIQRIQR